MTRFGRIISIIAAVIVILWVLSTFLISFILPKRADVAVSDLVFSLLFKAVMLAIGGGLINYAARSDSQAKPAKQAKRLLSLIFIMSSFSLGAQRLTISSDSCYRMDGHDRITGWSVFKGQMTFDFTDSIVSVSSPTGSYSMYLQSWRMDQSSLLVFLRIDNTNNFYCWMKISSQGEFPIVEYYPCYDSDMRFAWRISRMDGSMPSGK